MALAFTRLVRSNYDELDNIPIIHQDLTASFTKEANTYYIHTGSTTSAYTKGRMYYCDGTNLKKMVIVDELPTVNNGKLTITVNGTAYTFYANQAGDTSFSITDTDTGATSVEVTGNGNAVTAASYSASTRKLTLTKGTSFQEKLTAGSNITISGNTISATDTTYTFTASNPTLAWGTKSKIGTIGGVEFNVTMPANPNTDTGATSVETSGAGNAITAASYDAATRKLTLTKGTTFLTSHQSIKKLNTNNTAAQTANASEAINGSGTINLHKVAKTGNYNDLLNAPDMDEKANIKGGNTFKGTQTLTEASSGGYSINASGYIKGSWLQSSIMQNIGSNTGKVCVFDNAGWIYYRTPAEIYVDSHVTLTSEDLNSIVTVGNYIGSQSNTCANKPDNTGSTGFNLQVEKMGNWITQKYQYPVSPMEPHYLRKTSDSGNTWSEWEKWPKIRKVSLSGTTLTLSLS